MRKCTVNVQMCFHFNPISTYFLCAFVGQANSVLATIYLVCFEKIERFHFGERNHSSIFGFFFSFYFPRICLSSPPCLSSDIAYEIFLNGTFAYFFFSDMEFYKNKTVVTLFAPPSTPDFSGEVGLNLALGLVTSCCSCHTA